MRILLFLEICLIAVGIWSLVMMLYRLFLMPAKEDFAPLVLPVGEQADSVEGRCAGHIGRPVPAENMVFCIFWIVG